MEALHDPTIAFLNKLNDQANWQVITSAPIFIEHERDAKGKDGGDVKIAIGRDDLAHIAEQINEREQEYGVPAVITIGHRVQTNPTYNEKDQPDIVGYARHARVGVFGPKQTPAVLADLYIEKCHWNEARKYPFRSVDFYPGSNKVTGVALLKRDPFLAMGVIAYQGEAKKKPSLKAPNGGIVIDGYFFRAGAYIPPRYVDKLTSEQISKCLGGSQGKGPVEYSMARGKVAPVPYAMPYAMSVHSSPASMKPQAGKMPGLVKKDSDEKKEELRSGARRYETAGVVKKKKKLLPVSSLPSAVLSLEPVHEVLPERPELESLFSPLHGIAGAGIGGLAGAGLGSLTGHDPVALAGLGSAVGGMGGAVIGSGKSHVRNEKALADWRDRVSAAESANEQRSLTLGILKAQYLSALRKKIAKTGHNLDGIAWEQPSGPDRGGTVGVMSLSAGPQSYAKAPKTPKTPKAPAQPSIADLYRQSMQTPGAGNLSTPVTPQAQAKVNSGPTMVQRARNLLARIGRSNMLIHGLSHAGAAATGGAMHAGMDSDWDVEHMARGALKSGAVGGISGVTTGAVLDAMGGHGKQRKREPEESEAEQSGYQQYAPSDIRTTKSGAKPAKFITKSGGVNPVYTQGGLRNTLIGAGAGGISNLIAKKLGLSPVSDDEESDSKAAIKGALLGGGVGAAGTLAGNYRSASNKAAKINALPVAQPSGDNGLKKGVATGRFVEAPTADFAPEGYPEYTATPLLPAHEVKDSPATARRTPAADRGGSSSLPPEMPAYDGKQPAGARLPDEVVSDVIPVGSAGDVANATRAVGSSPIPAAGSQEARNVARDDALVNGSGSPSAAAGNRLGVNLEGGKTNAVKIRMGKGKTKSPGDIVGQVGREGNVNILGKLPPEPVIPGAKQPAGVSAPPGPATVSGGGGSAAPPLFGGGNVTGNSSPQAAPSEEVRGVGAGRSNRRSGVRLDGRGRKLADIEGSPTVRTSGHGQRTPIRNKIIRVSAPAPATSQVKVPVAEEVPGWVMNDRDVAMSVPGINMGKVSGPAGLASNAKPQQYFLPALGAVGRAALPAVGRMIGSGAKMAAPVVKDIGVQAGGQLVAGKASQAIDKGMDSLASKAKPQQYGGWGSGLVGSVGGDLMAGLVAPAAGATATSRDPNVKAQHDFEKRFKRTLIGKLAGMGIGGVAGAGLGALASTASNGAVDMERAASLGGLAGAGIGAGLGGLIGAAKPVRPEDVRGYASKAKPQQYAKGQQGPSFLSVARDAAISGAVMTGAGKLIDKIGSSDKEEKDKAKAKGPFANACGPKKYSKTMDAIKDVGRVGLAGPLLSPLGFAAKKNTADGKPVVYSSDVFNALDEASSSRLEGKEGGGYVAVRQLPVTTQRLHFLTEVAGDPKANVTFLQKEGFSLPMKAEEVDQLKKLLSTRSFHLKQKALTDAGMLQKRDYDEVIYPDIPKLNDKSRQTMKKVVAPFLKRRGLENAAKTIENMADNQNYQASNSVSYGAEHAPTGGITVGGKRYIGGQFIPAEVMDKATPEEKAALKSAKEGGKPQQEDGRSWFGKMRGDPKPDLKKQTEVMAPALKESITKFIADAPPEYKKEMMEHLNTTMSGRVGDFISKASPDELFELQREVVKRTNLESVFKDRAPKGGVVLEGEFYEEGRPIPKTMVDRATPEERGLIRGSNPWRRAFLSMFKDKNGDLSVSKPMIAVGTIVAGAVAAGLMKSAMGSSGVTPPKVQHGQPAGGGHPGMPARMPARMPANSPLATPTSGSPASAPDPIVDVPFNGIAGHLAQAQQGRPMARSSEVFTPIEESLSRPVLPGSVAKINMRGPDGQFVAGTAENPAAPRVNIDTWTPGNLKGDYQNG